MSQVDVNTFVGPYPFRHVPHPEPAVLARVLEREGTRTAWVGHLPSVFYRDPEPGNEELLEAIAPHATRMRPAPVVRPDWPHWERRLTRLVGAGAAAVRAYPPQWGLGPGDGRMRMLAGACAEAGVPLLLTVRLEDSRQRHWLDAAEDLSGAAIRDIARSAEGLRLVVTCAGRSLIEEVHWGLTVAERDRIWWDIAWVWGPPVDDLSHLLRTIGGARFVYGSGWPLRLAQTPRANLALLPADLGRAGLADVNAMKGQPA